jgi:hypothetical protein
LISSRIAKQVFFGISPTGGGHIRQHRYNGVQKRFEVKGAFAHTTVEVFLNPNGT